MTSQLPEMETLGAESATIVEPKLTSGEKPLKQEESNIPSATPVTATTNECLVGKLIQLLLDGAIESAEEVTPGSMLAGIAVVAVDYFIRQHKKIEELEIDCEYLNSKLNHLEEKVDKNLATPKPVTASSALPRGIGMWGYP